jgi:3-phosphoshikimate 1-carboxyvinyltransferase
MNGPLEVIPGRPCRAIVLPADAPLTGTIPAQPSKNYTTRYLLAAGLAKGWSKLRNVADSEDSFMMRRALQQMGVAIPPPALDSCGSLSISLCGVDGKPSLSSADPINPGNAGAVLRLLLGIGALLPEVTFITDRPDSLGKRPHGDLLEALSQLGCRCESRGGGYLPITLRGGSLKGGAVRVSGARSSQYLSSLLFLAPLVGEPVEVEVSDRLVSKAPVRQTVEVIRAAGGEIDCSEDLMRYSVRPSSYRCGEYMVNGDWPGSSAILAAAAVAGRSVTVTGLADDNQGEKACVEVLAQMGADIEFAAGLQSPTGEVRAGHAQLMGVEFDGDRATDSVLAMLGAACLAAGRSRFHNISNLRIKECDRISEPIAQLRRIGVACWEGREIGDSDPDSIVVDGDPHGYDGGLEVDGCRDHRVIMLLTIVGLRCRRGLTICGAEHVAKSYPWFFRHMSMLGAQVRLEPVPDA